MPSRIVGEFSVPYLQILDEEGNADPALDPDLGGEQLTKIYRAMVLAREADQRMLKLQRQGRVGTFGPCTGQEACVVGPAFAMGETDWFLGAFRELGVRLVRGEPLINPYLFHNGYEEGNMQPDGGPKRLLPISIVVGSHTLHAVGIAYAMKYRSEKSAVVVTFGDGATSQGDFHEALNFASVWQVPVVFICQNNQWAISLPRHKQTRAKTLAQKAIAYEMPGIQVDGNDALAMYKATRDALNRAKAGEGPTLIEAVTYRLLMHTTSDEPKRYRSEEEEKTWWQREPLIRFRRYLNKRGMWSDEKEAALREDVKKEVDLAVKEFESLHDFKPDAPFDHVFGTRHEVIEEQRQEFLATLTKENGHA